MLLSRGWKEKGWGVLLANGLTPPLLLLSFHYKLFSSKRPGLLNHHKTWNLNLLKKKNPLARFQGNSFPPTRLSCKVHLSFVLILTDHYLVLFPSILSDWEAEAVDYQLEDVWAGERTAPFQVPHNHPQRGKRGSNCPVLFGNECQWTGTGEWPHSQHLGYWNIPSLWTSLQWHDFQQHSDVTLSKQACVPHSCILTFPMKSDERLLVWTKLMMYKLRAPRWVSPL